MTADTGNITVSGQATTGALTVTGNGAVQFSGAVQAGAITASSTGTVGFSQNVQAASFAQTGTGSTTFNGMQDYSGNFSFTGTALTVGDAAVDTMTVGGTTAVNNSGLFILNAELTSTGTVTVASLPSASPTGSARLAADITAGTAADISFTGNIQLAKPNQETVTLSAGNTISLASSVTGPAAPSTNNLILEASLVAADSVTIAAGSNINSNGTIGTIRIDGNTKNSGTVTAGPVAAGNTAITFNGNYVGSAGSLNGAAGSDPYIDFYGDVKLGSFIHNDDIIRFVSSPGIDHEFGTGAASTLGDVIIQADNTVTANTTVTQASGKRLTLEQGSSLILAANMPAPTQTSVSWIQGATGSVPPFTTGFFGNNGTVIFDEDSKLETEDFYTAGSNHTVSLINGKSDITAWGHVDINGAFTDGSGGQSTIDYSTISMNGAGKILRTAPSVHMGNLVVNGGTSNTTNPASAAAGAVLGSDLVFAGSITINNGKVLDSASKKITVLPRPSPPAGEPDNFWRQDGTGQFLYRQGEVEFGDSADLAGGHTYALRGDTTWYTLVCRENTATLQFSNYVPGADGAPGTLGHSVFGDLVIKPVGGNTAIIKLTRETYVSVVPPNPYPNPSKPYASPQDPTNHFWYFTMDPTGKMDINYIIIEYSFSSRKIPVPMAVDEEFSISAFPYVAIAANVPSNPDEYAKYLEYSANSDSQFPILDTGDGYTMAFLGYHYNRWNVNWFVFNNFFYAYTEDSNHNGKIDRIRLQSAFDLNGNFSEFKVALSDAATGKSYTDAIDTTQGNQGYRLVQENPQPGQALDSNSIYVYLEESKMPYDTGIAFNWAITRNKSLRDKLTGGTLIGNDGEEDLEQDKGKTWDTAPPRITYALTLPGSSAAPESNRSEIFFQVSEKLDISGGLTVSVNGGPGIPAEAINDREFIVSLDDPFTPSQLAAGTIAFTVTGIRDTAEPAEDQSTPSQDPSKPRPYYFMYPSPKYPQNYNYDNKNASDSSQSYIFQSYIHVPTVGGVPTPSASPVFALPVNTADVVYPQNESYNPDTGEIAAVVHRVTDLLISVPPRKIEDENYFVWPLWAKYNASQDPDDQLGTLPPGYGYMGTGAGDAAFNDTGIIWDFSGRRFLERDEIVMQSRLNDAFSDTPQLVFDFNISDFYKAGSIHGSPGLWHSGPSSPLPDDINPSFVNMVPSFAPIGDVPLVPASPHLFNYEFSKNLFATNGMVEFFFRLVPRSSFGANPGADLLAGRLDIAAGDPIPADWYRRVRPFSFGIHDVTRQRGGVTILNNVINSEKRERVFVDYKLNNSGRVTIQVFTLDGNLVKVLVRENQNASDSFYRVSWDGTNNGGRPVARGMYFIRVVAPDIDEIRKVMVVK